MMFRSLALTILTVASTQAQDTCSVCGDGREVGNPDALFAFPGQPTVACGVLESAGAEGLIPLAECGFLPPLITTCECQPIAADTPAPVVPPTTAAPAAQSACSVCGDGIEVGNPDALFVFPGQPTVACGILESAGAEGLIPSDQCGFLPPLITVCECQPIAADTPAPVVPPTAAPVVPPTAAPVVPPTAAPVTPAPTMADTSAPVVPPTASPIVPVTGAPMKPPLPPTKAPALVFTPAPFRGGDDDDDDDDNDGDMMGMMGMMSGSMKHIR